MSLWDTAKAAVGLVAVTLGAAVMRAGIRLAGDSLPPPDQSLPEDPASDDEPVTYAVEQTEASARMVEEGGAPPPKQAPVPSPWDESLLEGSAAWQAAQLRARPGAR